jgi:putative transposase
LIACEAWSTTQERFAFGVFGRVFRASGCRDRTDNGVPFASAHALYGLSKLWVWWLRLEIQIERIKPKHPQQNGRHERMHLTLKREATKPDGGLEELTYPFHDQTILVSRCGRPLPR